MKKSAFTMIELVFVIVILGILAAVAIPKLTATRDDALVSKIAMNIMNGASEIASYAVSKGLVEDNLTSMSNGLTLLLNEGLASVDTSNKSITIKAGNVNDCVVMQVVSSSDDDNITITFNNDGGDSICKGVQSAIDATKYPMKIRGAGVSY